MFDLRAILDEQSDDPLDLVAQYVNPSFARVLKILGYDLNYVRGSGAYLWDDQGNCYIDCISGFGVFACGRNHPTIKDDQQVIFFPTSAYLDEDGKHWTVPVHARGSH